MAKSRPLRRTARAPRPYHHGDLRRALLDAAVQTIQHEGIDALTLRAVGARLRVSRTALYRHFSDKSALLAAVAREGFAMLRGTLEAAWDDAGRSRAGFEAMGRAYVSFAMANPSHYRVMFGSFLSQPSHDADLAREAEAAFAVLVTALAALQQEGVVRRDDPLQLARMIWAMVHGISMLGIDGLLAHDGADAETLSAFAVERMRTGIGAGAAARTD
jgi:AcrR family transcriptional regulator